MSYSVSFIFIFFLVSTSSKLPPLKVSLDLALMKNLPVCIL